MDLTNDELVTLLANSVHAAQLDGPLSTAEQAAIEGIRKDLGLKKTDVGRATRLASTPGYSPQPVGRLSYQVRSLEDMLYVCLIDGELAQVESVVVVTFARQAGLSDDQIRSLVPDAERRAKAIRGTAVCGTYGTTIPPDGRFCPSCGTPATPARVPTPVPVEIPIPSAGWTLEFAESTAASFPMALEDAKAAPTFWTVQRGTKPWYCATWPDESFGSVIAAAEHLRGLRHRRLYHDGAELDWTETFGFSWCAGKRAEAFKPFLYCFGQDESRLNPWGCKQVGLDWTEWATWFSFGSFSRTGPTGRTITWRFDKERLRHELETRMHRVRHCPHLRRHLASAVVEALPDQVTVKPGSPWKYKYGSADAGACPGPC